MEISNRDGLEAWLRGKSRDIAVLIAARAALRATPFLPLAFSRNYENPDRLILVSFRALAVAWSSVCGYNKNAAAATAASAAYSAAANADVAAASAAVDGNANPYAAYAAANAAAAANADAAANANAAANADAAANAAAAPAANVAAYIWREISTDCEMVDSGRSIEWFATASLYLWAGDPITDASHEALKEEQNLVLWRQVSDLFVKRDEGWDLWTHWFEMLVYGRQPNAAFEQAFLSLTDEEWGWEPAVVNARLKKLVAELTSKLLESQNAAISVFDIVQGKIAGRNYTIVPEKSPHAEGIYEELKYQLEKYKKRLAGFGDHPTASEILDDISRMIVNLGENLSDAHPGPLMQQRELLAIANVRLTADDANFGLPSDLSTVLPALGQCLKNFLGLYSDDLNLINTRADALDVSVQDYDAINSELKTLREAANDSDVVDESAVIALSEGRDILVALNVEIEKLKDDQEELRLELQNKRTLEQAREIRTAQNFGEILASGIKQIFGASWKGVLSGVENGTDKVTQGAFVTSFAMLAMSIAGPLAGLSAFVGSSFSNTVKKIHDIKTEALSDEEDSIGGE